LLEAELEELEFEALELFDPGHEVTSQWHCPLPSCTHVGPDVDPSEHL
jgi:hypothetical protein